MVSLFSLTCPEALAAGTCQVACMTGFKWLPSMLPLTSPGPSTKYAGGVKPCAANKADRCTFMSCQIGHSLSVMLAIATRIQARVPEVVQS